MDADGHVWLTQSRPITTLYPVPVRGAPLPADDTRVYFCVSLAQGLHRPITPMGIAAFRVIGSGFLDLVGRRPERIIDGPGGFAVGGDRIFVDATPIVRSAVGREIMPRALDVMEARSAVVLRGLFADPRFSVLPRIPAPFRAAGASSRRPDPVAVRRRAGALQPRGRAAPGAAARRRGPCQRRPGGRRHPDPGRRRRRPALRRDAARTAQPARRGRRLRHARARRAAAARLDAVRRPADRAPQRARQRDHGDGSRHCGASPCARGTTPTRRPRWVRRPRATSPTATAPAPCPPSCSAA